MTRVIFFLLLISALPAHAQMPTAPEALPDVDSLFANASQHNTLNCSVSHFSPFLDFTFRYEAGFFVTVSPQQFLPTGKVRVYLRATPQGGEPEFLGERFDIPPIPPQMAKTLSPKDLKRVELQLSVGFAVGDGHYAIDLLLMDAEHQFCREHWNLKTPKHNHPLSLPPNTVVPIESDSWDGKLNSDGVRLTVLLDVAPINPYASRLYAWDRTFLLQSLASLLKQLPCQSVRVIGFNLDEQQELFHQDNFDGDAYALLAETLRKLEFGTVSYKALRYGSGESWLTDLVHEQTIVKNPSDAVVFLGPTSHFRSKIPGVRRDNPEAPPHFFYLEYFPWFGGELSDSIDFLTRDMHGAVYKFHSADQLGQSIEKMQAQMKQAQKVTASSTSTLSTRP